jgi:hypothetical protein
LDFNFKIQTNNPAKMTKVFKSYFGRKYVIPAEYDIFIDFAPISYKPDTQTPLAQGKFQFLVKWVADVAEEYKTDDTVEIVYRLPPLADGTEVTPIPVNDDADSSDKDQFEQ